MNTVMNCTTCIHSWLHVRGVNECFICGLVILCSVEIRLEYMHECRFSALILFQAFWASLGCEMNACPLCCVHMFVHECVPVRAPSQWDLTLRTHEEESECRTSLLAEMLHWSWTRSHLQVSILYLIIYSRHLMLYV